MIMANGKLARHNFKTAHRNINVDDASAPSIDSYYTTHNNMFYIHIYQLTL